MNTLTDNKKLSRRSQLSICLFTILSVWLLFFEEPVSLADIPVISVFRNAMPLLAVLFFMIECASDSKKIRLLTSPYAICGLIFIISGLMGYLMHQYQSLSVTLQAMNEHIRFWLTLYLYIGLFSRLPLRRYAKHIFIHISLLSAIIAVAGILDELLKIWPRQIYRFGIGSIQLWYGHPSNLGARSVFLTAMLCILYPYLLKEDGHHSRLSRMNQTLTLLMLLITAATLRFRLMAFAVFFIVMYIPIVLCGKRLRLPLLCAASGITAAIGSLQFYKYFISSGAQKMARGAFVSNSVDIAAENFPFGSGFGTFGSRLAQIHYSPLYYKYRMHLIQGMAPSSSNYACDIFYPVILGEAGWLGFAAYFSMVIMLLVLILKNMIRNKQSAVEACSSLAALSIIVYELVEALGTLAFSETYSVLIAIALGLALSQKKGCQAG